MALLIWKRYVVKLARPELSSEQRSVQNAEQEQEEENDQLQIADGRKWFEKRSNCHLQALIFRRQLQRSQHTKDSQRLKRLQAFCRIRVKTKQGRQNDNKVQAVPSLF